MRAESALMWALRGYGTVGAGKVGVCGGDMDNPVGSTGGVGEGNLRLGRLHFFSGKREMGLAAVRTRYGRDEHATDRDEQATDR